jgi:hypothetical protein
MHCFLYKPIGESQLCVGWIIGLHSVNYINP